MFKKVLMFYREPTVTCFPLMAVLTGCEFGFWPTTCTILF